GGGYSIYCNGNMTNNGTLSGNFFKFSGTNFTNNGTVTPGTFQFASGAQNATGLGPWGTTANILSGANVTLTGNFQLRDVNVNIGGTVNLSTFRLLVTGSNPIVNSETFTSSSGSIEYNGTLNQNISTTNVT